MVPYVHTLSVPQTVIDANGHANNVAYLQWMQDAAVAHSQSVGGVEATLAIKATWVVRRHTIEYRRPAYAGEIIEVRTWIHDFRRVASTRRYEFHRPSDGAILAIGETEWIFLDRATLRPRSIPPEIQKLYSPEPL